MSGRRRLLALALTATLVLSVVGLGVGVAPVQGQPEAGATYYGEVYIDGEPAPVGTHVAAVVDGVQQDSMTIEEPGQYGGPGADDEELVVDAESGDEVQFFVNGEPVDTDPSPVEWEAYDSEKVDLYGTDVGTPNVAVDIDEDASVTEVQPNDTAAVVAEVTNTGDGDALERTIAFEVDGERRDATDVSLSPGESRELQFSAAFDAEGDYQATVDSLDDSDSVTITVDESAGGGPGLPPPPEDPGDPAVTVTDASLSESEIATGESVTIEATLENAADSGTFATLPITVDGDELRTETVYVEGGAEVTVTFEQTFDEAGEYEIAVDDVEAGTLTVGSADLQVLSAGVNETEIDPGTAVEVTAVVENQGTVIGETTLELVIDGETVDSRSVSVHAGASDPFTFEHTFEEEGEYDVAVNDASAGTVTVSTDSGGDGIPGFGPVAAVIALLALAAAGVATNRQ